MISPNIWVYQKNYLCSFSKKEQLVLETAMTHIDVILDRIISISKHSKDPIIELYQLKKEAMKHLGNEKTHPNINFRNTILIFTLN